MSGTNLVTLRYFAAARAQAGCASETFDAVTLADALAQAGMRHGQGMRDVLGRCSVLVDGARSEAAQLAAPLTGPVTADALPPFAGG